MVEYLASDLSAYDKDIYREKYLSLDDRIKGEFKAYSKFIQENKNEFIGKISNFLNDTYLKSQGTEGVASYSAVVRMSIGYLVKEGLIPSE
jgi:hypothetical protein